MELSRRTSKSYKTTEATCVFCSSTTTGDETMKVLTDCTSAWPKGHQFIVANDNIEEFAAQCRYCDVDVVVIVGTSTPQQTMMMVGVALSVGVRTIVNSHTWKFIQNCQSQTTVTPDEKSVWSFLDSPKPKTVEERLSVIEKQLLELNKYLIFSSNKLEQLK